MNLRYPAVVCLTIGLLLLSILAAAAQGSFSLSWSEVLEGVSV